MGDILLVNDSGFNTLNLISLIDYKIAIISGESLGNEHYFYMVKNHQDKFMALHGHDTILKGNLAELVKTN